MRAPDLSETPGHFLFSMINRMAESRHEGVLPSLDSVRTAAEHFQAAYDALLADSVPL